MALQRLDPERRRKRLAVIAERAATRRSAVVRSVTKTQAVRLRELIEVRKRLAG